MLVRSFGRGAFAAWMVSFVLVTGCLDRQLAPVSPCTISPVVRNVRPEIVDKIDLLFVIDDSNSMSQEQESLTQQFPRLVEVLASGDLTPDDGITEGQDFPPVNSLRIGVVTTDMGTGGFRVPTCAEPNFGDDGILQTSGNASTSGCMATYPPFQEFNPGGDAVRYAQDVSCVATLGTGGCGFEQQLEATIKAVTPSTSTMAFNMGTTGHADRQNMGFVRPDSLLAVIVVTDEEDCSAADPELYNQSTGVYPGNPNLRCFQYPSALHPVQRFVDALLETRRNTPDLLMFATIGGVPPDLVDDPSNIDFQRILDDPRMQAEVDPDEPTQVRAACNVPGRGRADPARRFVQVAQQLEARGSNGVIQSICQADFTPALDAIVAKIARLLNQTCLPRALNPTEDGTVHCDVIEVLPLEGEVTRCDQLPGRARIGEEEIEGGFAEVCRVDQQGSAGDTIPTSPGWYYDDFTTDVSERCGSDGQRIAFTDGAGPVNGTRVRLECLQPVQQGSDVIIDIGSPCAPEEGDETCAADGPPASAPGSRCSRDLTCDQVSRTWRQSCEADAHCASGWACGPDRFCANPACEG